MVLAVPFLSFLLATFSLGVRALPSCRPESIALPIDYLPGASILDVQAKEYKRHQLEGLSIYFDGGVIKSACVVDIFYNYPGTSSSQLQVTIFLPEEWNGRFMGTGGGGMLSSMGPAAMIEPNQDGYATALTNGGLTGSPFEPTNTLYSPGNPNKGVIERLGYRAIHEMTVLGKKVVEGYYGRPAKTNIFNGCSTGGRQGLMEASLYPEDYDGIVAGAPAARWNHVVISGLAHQAVMAEENYFPSSCELSAITDSAISACDKLDGLVDGIISRPDLCKFHASSAVGKEYKDTCSGVGTAKVTAKGAKILQRYIEGIYATNGEKITVGFPWGTALWSPMGFGRTKLDEKTGQLTFDPSGLAQIWVNHFVNDGLSTIDFPKLTVDKVQALIKEAKLKYDYAMEPQPDLTAFKNRGGKILTYHGIEDEIISAYNSLEKYSNVQDAMFPRGTMAKNTEKMQDFWRLFIVPATQHCVPLPGKMGSKATSAYRQLTQWVEDGVAPHRLESAKTNQTYSNMCVWPSKPYWRNGQIECQNGLSTWDAYPSIHEVVTKFFEWLPTYLLLESREEL